MENEAYNNKKIPELLKPEIIKALSFYPALKDVPIIFKLKEHVRGSLMQAQPHVKTILKGRKGYVINISKYLLINNNKMRIQDLPENVLVGWIGHELGHVMDYIDRTFLGMVKFGFGYIFSRKFILGAERDADINAIKHGLSENIISAKNFILNHSELPKKYKEKIRRFYMSPEEVLELANSFTIDEKLIKLPDKGFNS